MSKDRAVVEAELAGAPKVEADAKKINRALSDVKKTAGEGIAAGVNKSTASLQVMGAKADAVRAALSPTALLGGFIGGAVASTISGVADYLERASDAARAFGEHTSGVARRAGVEYGALSKATAQQARHSLQGADAGLDFVDAVQQLSYGGKGAADSLRDVDTVATALGRSDKDLAPLIASFQALYGLNVNVGREMNTLIEKAQRLHTIGGAQALVDSVAALRPTLAQVSAQSQEAKDKLVAFQAVASKSRTPEQAAALTGAAVSFVKGNANKIAMTPGLGLKYGDIIDPATGQPRDPIATMQAVQKWANTKGKTPEERAFRLGNSFGADALPLFGFDYGEVNTEAAREKEKRTPAAIARQKEEYARSEQGQIAAREAARQRRELAAGKRLEVLRRPYERAVDYFKNDLLQGFAPRGRTKSVSSGDDTTALLKKIAENTDPNKPPASAVQLGVKAKPAGNR